MTAPEKIPAGLLGAGILLWGWQTGLWPLALLSLLPLEGWRLVSWRWELTPTGFQKVADACTVLLVAAVAYALMNVDRAVILLGLPIITMPLVAAQLFSVQGRTDLSALFYFLRLKSESGSRASADISYAYLMITLISAGTPNVRTPFFYLAALFLLGWALWRVRPPSTRTWVWLGLLLLAGAVGNVIHTSLYRLQPYVEGAAIRFFFDFANVAKDPYSTYTAIGTVGRLKQSDAIVLRVRSADEGPVPVLLRNASYNTYKSAQWFVSRADFRPAASGAEKDSWLLTEVKLPPRRVEVVGRMKDGRGVLVLPGGTAAVERLPADKLATNQLGTVRMDGGPVLTDFTAAYTPGSSISSPPSAADLRVDKDDVELFAGLADRLGLPGKKPAEALRSVRAFFEDGFVYSIIQDAPAKGRDPLEHFLLHSRSGHCEYYATATVLLLRAAGIPARYMTGFSAHEFSRLEDAYIVRQRHAHAWTKVHIDGRWKDVDTTPSVWREAEARSAGLMEPLRDLWSWASHRFALWRKGLSREDLERVAKWLIGALILILMWRLRPGGRRVRLAQGTNEPGITLRPGLDSEWYRIESALASDGLGRQPWETHPAWLARLERSGARPDLGPLRPLSELHQRLRFDPEGLAEDEREALRRDSLAWLELRRRRDLAAERSESRT